MIVAAKRARQINNYYHTLGEGVFEEFPPPMVETPSKNYLTIALEEVAQGKLTYRYRSRRHGGEAVGDGADPARSQRRHLRLQGGRAGAACDAGRPLGAGGPDAREPRFVGRATFEGITGAPVLVEEFERDPARGAYPGEASPDHDPISHLELVAAATRTASPRPPRNTIAKLATGQADNLLTRAYLACTSPVLVAPAMNNHMYEHPATQANLSSCATRGVHVIEPGTGPLASRGEWGVGRLRRAGRRF